ncbi:MAG: TIGR02253 family HAD-type hydrolase [Asgard group archaeon]|nr:TIGR02253 family HAD-type hydrolase [Asgard group archaeon]
MPQQQFFQAVLFDIDDTLYNSTFLSTSARKNAIRAMIEAGLDCDEEETFDLLMDIVRKYGSNYGEHFNRLLEKLGYQQHPKLIAAAVVAYHSEKFALLQPFPDAIITLLTIMKHNIKIGIVSDGRPVKQWEKLIHLGIQHFFDVVVINDKSAIQKPHKHGYVKACKRLAISDYSTVIYIGNKTETDILGANKLGMKSILLSLDPKITKNHFPDMEKPDYIINRLSQVCPILGLGSCKSKLKSGEKK